MAEIGIPCAGNCGKNVLPAEGNCDSQRGPWYCTECFKAEAARREAE